MVLISGVLKGPYGDSRSGVTITMRSTKTSSTVLNLAKSQSVTDDTGRYSLNAEPGAYEVIVSVYGAQPERVGTIEVYTDSLPGTLNDFLRRPGESDITPEIVQTVDRLRADAALSADKSAASASAAKVSELNAATSAAQVATSFDNVRWPVPDNSASSPAWFLLGTFKRAGQKGVGIAINFYGNARYSGFIEHAGLSRLILRTGNLTTDGTTNNVGRIGGVLVDDAAVDGSTSLIRGIQIIESTRDNYDIYVMVGEFTSNCWYVVEQNKYEYAAGLRWEHKGISQTTAPTGVMKVDILRSVSYSIVNGVLPNYASVAKPFSNGFGTYSGRRISGADVESQVSLMTTLRGRGSEIFRVGGGAKIGMPPDGTSIHLMSGDVSAVIAVDYNNGNVNTMTCNGTGLAAGIVKSNILWGTSNTTVDANGFIKKASPIVRLSAAPEHMQADYLEGGFALAGCAAVNGEADGVSVERISVGVYQLKGSLGLAKEGWTIEVPQDVNGNRLCFVETATDSDGVITVKISKRRFAIDTATVVAGEAMDIPEGRWIDLRLTMPVHEVVEVLPPEALVSNDDTPSEANAAS